MKDKKPYNRIYPKSDGIYYKRILLESAAYHQLTSTAIHVLNIFYLRRRFPNKKDAKKSGISSDTITNNGQIVFTYKEASKYGIKNPKTFSNAIEKLDD